MPDFFLFCRVEIFIECRRWLVHSIAEYYGLRTWSVTVGDPARREAYVGIKGPDKGESVRVELPRPLYVMA